MIACDINEMGMKKWENNPNVTVLVVDLTNLKVIHRVFETVETVYHHQLNGLLNIAGINDLSYPLLETDDARWNRVMNIDLKAPFRLIRDAVPFLKAQGGGSIVYVDSYAALRGNHGPSYTAAKTGLVGLTKSVAFGHARDNIRCNVIHPGGYRH